MKSLLIIPVLILVLGSCTMNDLSAKRINQPKIPSGVQSFSGTVLPETKETLIMAYSEELLAHDIYTKIVEKYPNLAEIKNIVSSEANHREQVGRLLDVRNITRPTGYGVFGGTYDVLIKMVDSSMTGAIEAGVMIETGDIDHLLAEYKKINDRDVRMVFENIGGGSFNHLRAFLRIAKANNYIVKTDYARYMNVDEINSTGPLQSKMTDLLSANNLPTYGGGSMGMGNGQGKHMMGSGAGENNRMMMQWNGQGNGNGQWQGNGQGRGR